MVFFQEIYRKVVAMGGKRRTGYSTELPGANVYTVPCPIIHALNLIGGKWKLPVLWHATEPFELPENAGQRLFLYSTPR